MTIPDVTKMNQSELDDFVAVLKTSNPNLYQFIINFIDERVSIKEVEAFQKMEHQAQQLYIKNYKARV